MRKALVFTAILLLLVTLACNLPRPTSAPGQESPSGRTGPFAKKGTATATLYPMCTPPACQPDEVYYCPGDCPGGCGTTCATPTGSPPTMTPVPPTSTPFPMCTPPACQPDEVYFCPGDCPGGCGTTCATPTPEPISGPPTILSFTADRAAITEGESVDVTWQATGGTDAAITWLGSGVMDGIGNLNPDSGAAAIAPKGNPVTLRVSNAEGFTEATLDLTIACAHAWVPELAARMADKCPFEAQVGWAAQQPFEHGIMTWLEPSQTIYVFFDKYGGQSYRNYEDTFTEGDPESDPNIVPPTGLLQPVRGFGQVWRENPEVRDNLGWATASETGFDTWRQSYQGFGMHNITIWMKTIDGDIHRLTPMGSVWEVYVP